MMDLPGFQTKIQLPLRFGMLDDKTRSSLNMAWGYHMAYTPVKHHIDLILTSYIRSVIIHSYSLKDDEFHTKIYENKNKNKLAF